MPGSIDSLRFWQVKVAVEACLAGIFAGDREECTVAELRSLLFNWRAREVDSALAALARDGEIVVTGGVVRMG